MGAVVLVWLFWSVLSEIDRMESCHFQTRTPLLCEQQLLRRELER